MACVLVVVIPLQSLAPVMRTTFNSPHQIQTSLLESRLNEQTDKLHCKLAPERPILLSLLENHQTPKS